MSDGSKLVQWLEQHLKEQQADITLMRLVMQKFLVRILASSAGAEERLQDLKSDVIEALGRTPQDPQNQGAEEMVTLTETRSEQFFGELEGMLAIARDGRTHGRQIIVVSPYLQQL
jgi:hypothetical protein